MNLSKVFKKAVKIEDGFQSEVRRLEDAIKAKEERSRASIYAVIDSVVKMSLYKYRRVVDSHDIDEMSLKLYDSITKTIAKAYTHNARIKDDLSSDDWMKAYEAIQKWSKINFKKYYSKNNAVTPDDVATSLLTKLKPVLEKYDPSKGKSFENYIYQWCDQKVKDDPESSAYTHRGKDAEGNYVSGVSLRGVGGQHNDFDDDSRLAYSYTHQHDDPASEVRATKSADQQEAEEASVHENADNWQTYGEGPDPHKEEEYTDRDMEKRLEQFNAMSYEEQEEFLNKWKRVNGGKDRETKYDKFIEALKKAHVAKNDDPVAKAANEAGATDIKKTEKDGFPCTRIQFGNAKQARYFKTPEGYTTHQVGSKLFVYNKAEIGVADSKIKDVTNQPFKKFIPLASLTDNAYTALN